MNTLTDLQQSAISNATAAQDHAQQAINYAIACGEDLIKIKAEIGHGNFTPWIKNNMPVSDHQCRKYIKVAQNRDLLKRTRESDLDDLSINGALRFIKANLKKKPLVPVNSPLAKELAKVEAKGLVPRLAVESRQDAKVATEVLKIQAFIDEHGALFLESEKRTIESLIESLINGAYEEEEVFDGGLPKSVCAYDFEDSVIRAIERAMSFAAEQVVARGGCCWSIEANTFVDYFGPIAHKVLSEVEEFEYCPWDLAALWLRLGGIVLKEWTQ